MHTIRFLIIAFAALAVVAAAGPSQAGGYPGWGLESKIDQMYDTSEFDKIKGYFEESFEITPFEGMAEGYGLTLKDRADGEIVKVILGPKDYVKEGFEELGIRGGQKIKVYGAWCYINGEDVIVATKVKVTDDLYLKFRRTSDGLAYWNMPQKVYKAEMSQEKGNTL
jgi:hypothetical protein